MNWANYYLSRVNSLTYDIHFNAKYNALLSYVVDYVRKDTSIIIVEEGCGIGNVTRQLLNQLPNNPYLLLDRDKEMLKLAKENLKYFTKADISFGQKDILAPLSVKSPCEKIVITHGVLEHFSDKDIVSIINNYKKSKIVQFHYVPTNGYKSPSFGDERLLSLQDWVELANPCSYTHINKQDLYFKITP